MFSSEETFRKKYGVTPPTKEYKDNLKPVIDRLNEISKRINKLSQRLEYFTKLKERERLKIFLDTAKVEEIRTANSWGVIDGITTNPSLIHRSGRSFEDCIYEIVQIVNGPISAEVISLDEKGMVKEARELARIHENINIKIPITPEGLKAIKTLSKEGIKTNATLCFSANQAILAAKAGATFVSPFIGRLDDIGNEGMQIVREIVQIYKNYGFDTKVIVASIRHPIHVIQAAIIGADIVTVPFDVLQKMVKHALTDVGIKRFLDDWAKVPKK